VDSARAAQRSTAPVFGASQSCGIPNRPQQGCIKVNIELVGGAVDMQLYHGYLVVNCLYNPTTFRRLLLRASAVGTP
jgi:hypothetical protein